MLKFQKIRYCENCRELLPLKCGRCTKHPNRKPTVQEVYDWPPILETRDCGCIKIACQRSGCLNTMWRHLAHTRNKMAPARRQFCSVRCTSLAVAKDREKKQQVPCADCGKKVIRKAFSLKTWKHSFCSVACRVMFYRKEKEAEQEKDQKKQLLACYSEVHRGQITEHITISGSLNECASCGNRRKAIGLANPYR